MTTGRSIDGKMSTFMRPKLSTPSTSIRSAITATESGRRSARRTIHIRYAESELSSLSRNRAVTSQVRSYKYCTKWFEARLSRCGSRFAGKEWIAILPLLVRGEVGAILIAPGEVQRQHTRDAYSCTEAIVVPRCTAPLPNPLL